MKTLVFFTTLLMSMAAFGQSTALDGAYLAAGNTNTLWLFKSGYCSKITYGTNNYIATQGGPYTFDGKALTITWEYNDAKPETVGSQTALHATVQPSSLTLEGQVLEKQPNKQQGLDGLWRITGRQNAEKIMNNIPRGDRKTIKILVDGYFQWVAINPATKGFYGTGGGKHSFSNGRYEEHIVFFSRDNSRVGAKLGFNGEIKDGAWHHSGLSSKGDPIYEIWSLE